MKKLRLSILTMIVITGYSNGLQASNTGAYATQTANQVGNYVVQGANQVGKYGTQAANQIGQFANQVGNKIFYPNIQNNNNLTETQKQKLQQQAMQATMQDITNSMTNQTGAHTDVIQSRDAQSIAQSAAMNQALNPIDPTMQYNPYPSYGKNLTQAQKNRLNQQIMRSSMQDIMANISPEDRQNQAQVIAPSKPFAKIPRGKQIPQSESSLFSELQIVQDENQALKDENQLLKQQLADLQNNSSAAQ